MDFVNFIIGLDLMVILTAVTGIICIFAYKLWKGDFKL
jgi:hypothetical protein